MRRLTTAGEREAAWTDRNRRRLHAAVLAPRYCCPFGGASGERVVHAQVAPHLNAFLLLMNHLRDLYITTGSAVLSLPSLFLPYEHSYAENGAEPDRLAYLSSGRSNCESPENFFSFTTREGTRSPKFRHQACFSSVDAAMYCSSRSGRAHKSELRVSV